MRRILAVLIAALFCSGSVSAAQETIELRVAWWGSQNRHDRTLEVIKLFEEAHPNIKVFAEFTGWNDYWTRLATQAAGRNLPDVIQQDYQEIAEWTSRNLLIPLDKYVETGVIDLSNVAESQISGGRVNGQLYGINLGTNSLTMVFNPALFDKAGVALPGPDWTWDDFKRIAIDLHNQLGIYGMDGGFYNVEVFKTWLKEHGDWLYNDAGTALGYDDDSLFVDFFRMILDLQEAGAIPTRAFDVARGDIGIEDGLIVTQEAAMAFMWSNQIVAVSTASGGRPLEMGLMPQLGTPNAIPGNYMKPSMFFSVTSQSEHPEEAAMFIDFFTNSIEANEILFAERGVPISSVVRDALRPMLGPAQAEMFDFIGLAETYSSPIEAPDPPGHGEILSNVYDPLVDQVLYGRMSLENAARAFRSQANAILRQNR